MEVSGQLHALATLATGKFPAVSICRRLVWTLWKKECLTPALQRQARRLVAMPTELS
jgi:hypothetical protein